MVVDLEIFTLFALFIPIFFLVFLFFCVELQNLHVSPTWAYPFSTQQTRKSGGNNTFKSIRYVSLSEHNMSSFLTYFGIGGAEDHLSLASCDVAYDTLLEYFPSTLLTNVVCVVGPNEARGPTHMTPKVNLMKSEKVNGSCPNAQEAEEEEKREHQRSINWRTSFISEALRVPLKGTPPPYSSSSSSLNTSDPYHLRFVKPVSRSMFKEILDAATSSSYCTDSWYASSLNAHEEGEGSARSNSQISQNEYSSARKKRDLLRRDGVFTICPIAGNNKLVTPRSEGGDEKSPYMYQDAAKGIIVRHDGLVDEDRENVSGSIRTANPRTDYEYTHHRRDSWSSHCDIFISEGLYDSVARRVGFRHILPSPPLPPLCHTMIADVEGIPDRKEIKEEQENYISFRSRVIKEERNSVDIKARFLPSPAEADNDQRMESNLGRAVPPYFSSAAVTSSSSLSLPSETTRCEPQLLRHGHDYTSITVVDVERAMREATEACAGAILSVGTPSAHMRSLVTLKHKLLSTAFLELNVEPNNEEEASMFFTNSMNKTNKRKEDTHTSNRDNDGGFMRFSQALASEANKALRPPDQHHQSVSRTFSSRMMFGQRVHPDRLVPLPFRTNISETFSPRLSALPKMKKNILVALESFFPLAPLWYQQWPDRLRESDSKKHSSKDLFLKNPKVRESEVTVYKNDHAAMRDALATHVIKQSGRIYYVVPPPPPPTALPLAAREPNVSSSKSLAYSQWFSHIKSKGLAAKEAKSAVLIESPCSSSSPQKYTYCGDASSLSPKILWNVFPIFPSPATRESHSTNNNYNNNNKRSLGDHHLRNEIEALLAPYHNKNNRILREGKDEPSSFAGVMSRSWPLPNEPVVMTFDHSRAAPLHVHHPHTLCAHTQHIHHTNWSSPPAKKVYNDDACLESNECSKSSRTEVLDTFPSANSIAPIMIAPNPSRAYGVHDLRSKETVSATCPTLPLIFDETSSPVPDQHGVLFVANHKKARYFDQNVLSTMKTPPPLVHASASSSMCSTSSVVGKGDTPTLCGVISDLHMSLLRRRIATMPPPQMLERNAAHIPGGTIPYFTHTTPAEDAEEERIVRELGTSRKCLGFAKEQTSFFFAPVDTN